MSTMSKRAALMLEGNLDSPPLVSDFLATLQAWVDKENAPKPIDPVHGAAFDNIKVGKPSGSQYCQKAGVKCALEFKELCAALQTPDYATLDAWLLGFSRWVLKADMMFDDPDVAKKFDEDRTQKAQGVFKMYNMTPSSVRTYLNALGRAYNDMNAQPFLVMSSTKQFPETNAFMRMALTREATKRSLKTSNAHFDDAILKDEDLPKLHSATDFTKPLQVQRHNALIFAYRTGFRPEMITRLKVGSIKTEIDPTGRKVMNVVMGSMKQLIQDMSKCDLALFQCPMMQGDNPLTCPVAAVERQLQLLRNIGALQNLEHEADSPLFRSVRGFSLTLMDAPPSKELFRGIADWVSTTLGTKRQFRDLS